MANRKNWLGILVIALVFGMMVIGCDEEPTDDGGGDGSGSGSGSGGGNGSTAPALIGTWINETISEIRFYNGNGETIIKPSGNPFTRWTYTTYSGYYIYTITHMHGSYFASSGLESRWYTSDELKNIGINTTVEGIINYSISGNTLTLTPLNGVSDTWHKK